MLKNNLKKTILSALSLLIILICSAQPVKTYKTLDPKQPIVFGGKYIVYAGDTVTLGPNAFFIDGQLTNEQVTDQPYVFNSFNKALDHLSNGSEAAPMVLYIAPYVYWIDDPDDPTIRVSANNEPPYGKIVKCDWLKFYGLSGNAKNVVLACNRGQTIGAKGNFTMFKFIGQGTSAENITFGNYCNIDLEYPLLPNLSRPKRALAIVQAQLIHCNGDKIVARNTRFVSRLNLCPFVGGKRVLFDRCHFESTDDALCGTGVYLNCTLDFYASKPFYSTSGTGAVFLNCNLKTFSNDNQQYFTKVNGQVAVVDSRFKTPNGIYLGWRDVVPAEMRNYQFNVMQNGKAIFISKKDPSSTVEMSGKSVLDAYRFVHNGKVIYNTYNLLRGDDDWDPMHIRDIVLAASKENSKSYTIQPVQLLIAPTRIALETKKNEATLSAKVMRFGNYPLTGTAVKWKVAPEQESLVQLKVSENGDSCIVVPTNTNDDTRQVIVTATTTTGLQAASVLTVAPSKLESPKFTSTPTIAIINNGILHANYKLDMKFKDQSRVTWYRCSDAKGSNPIEVSVSRFDNPLLNYTLSAGDIGYYMMISVAPKHLRCDAGEPVNFIMKKPITAKDVRTASHVLYTDFKNISTRNQPEVLPGFWTWEHFEPEGNTPRYAVNKKSDAWYYGEGSEGAANMFGLLQGRSAAMRFTPTGNKFGDMKLTMTVAPFKTAGQGFAVAPLYMDVLIKFDNSTMTGYALRFIRTTKYHNAVDCIIVKYQNGKVTNISEPVSTTTYKSICKISIEVTANKILAQATTTAPSDPESHPANVMPSLKLETTITPNEFGGLGIQYNGGSPTLIKEMRVEWK
jgi:hypothetical protein